MWRNPSENMSSPIYEDNRDFLDRIFGHADGFADLTGVACHIFKATTGIEYSRAKWVEERVLKTGQFKPVALQKSVWESLQSNEVIICTNDDAEGERVVCFPLDSCVLMLFFAQRDYDESLLRGKCESVHGILLELRDIERDYKRQLDSIRVIAARAEHHARQVHLVQNKYEEMLGSNLEKNEQLVSVNAKLEDRVRQRTDDLERSMNTVTRQKEEILRLSQFKDELIRMIVHDLKTPVGVVMNVLEGLLEGVFDPVEDAAIFESSLESATNMRDLINTMLDMTKLRSGKLELYRCEVALKQMIESLLRSLELFAGEKKLQLEADIEPGIDVIYADQSLLQRTLNNLLSNAVKYADQDGHVVVHVRYDKENDAVVISVENEGRNIPPALHYKIFDMFEQAHNEEEPRIEGTGIGLTFCRLAVEAHDGQIYVVSPLKDGRSGAEFVFTIPQGL
jgi:signal transduction histidine kinase